MGNFCFNRAKGRVTEWGERINNNDPADAVLVIRLIQASGVEADATLLDKDTFADLVSGSTDFATNTGAGQKTLSTVTVTYDDTNDRVDLDIPDQTWTAVQAAPGGITDLVTGYDPDSTGGTDAAIVPATWHDFVVTPNGSDITAQIATAGIFRAA